MPSPAITNKALNRDNRYPTQCTENLVKQRLSTPEARVNGLLSAAPQLSRAELSRRVEFGFCLRASADRQCGPWRSRDGRTVLPPRGTGAPRGRRFRTGGVRRRVAAGAELRAQSGTRSRNIRSARRLWLVCRVPCGFIPWLAWRRQAARLFAPGRVLVASRPGVSYVRGHDIAEARHSRYNVLTADG